MQARRGVAAAAADGVGADGRRTPTASPPAPSVVAALAVFGLLVFAAGAARAAQVAAADDGGYGDDDDVKTQGSYWISACRPKADVVQIDETRPGSCDVYARNDQQKSVNISRFNVSKLTRVVAGSGGRVECTSSIRISWTAEYYFRSASKPRSRGGGGGGRDRGPRDDDDDDVSGFTLTLVPTDTISTLYCTVLRPLSINWTTYDRRHPLKVNFVYDCFKPARLDPMRATQHYRIILIPHKRGEEMQKLDVATDSICTLPPPSNHSTTTANRSLQPSAARSRPAAADLSYVWIIAVVAVSVATTSALIVVFVLKFRSRLAQVEDMSGRLLEQPDPSYESMSPDNDARCRQLAGAAAAAGAASNHHLNRHRSKPPRQQQTRQTQPSTAAWNPPRYDGQTAEVSVDV